MKYYKLSGYINGKYYDFKTKFTSRTEAVNYAFSLMPATVKLDKEVKKSKHEINYVCDTKNTLTVQRFKK